MSNRLDNYFRERLRNHNTSPSSSAWDKVEARISKKNSTSTVLKIAAAIALVGLVTIALTVQQRDTSTPQITEKKNIENPSPGVETSKKDDAASGANSQRTVSKSHASVIPKVRKEAQPPSVKKNVEVEATVRQETLVMESIEPELIAPQEKSKTKRIVIVYTLPTINKPTQDVAVVEESKSTGLRKVMEVAMEVRASDSPLGPLREAKDDLFALEFKKDKNKTKN